MSGWRQQISSNNDPSQLVESYLYDGEVDVQNLGITFGVTWIIVYLILILTRPSIVVYRDKEEIVPTFHHGAAFLWALVFGMISIGLLTYA
jgi:hypothetical protein